MEFRLLERVNEHPAIASVAGALIVGGTASAVSLEAGLTPGQSAGVAILPTVFAFAGALNRLDPMQLPSTHLGRQTGPEPVQSSGYAPEVVPLRRPDAEV